MSRFACACAALVVSIAAAGTAVEHRVNNESDQSVTTGRYRIWFSRTYGDDHLCLTEIAFYDESNTRMNATLVSMSSCYGCNTCVGCEHRYGNPKVLFDNVANVDTTDAWMCTAPGTFNADGVGAQQVVFTLPKRPQVYVLQRPQANGDWVTRDFSLEQELIDYSWLILHTAADAEKQPDQRYNATLEALPNLSSLDNPYWSYDTPDDWVRLFPACGGTQQSPIDLETMPPGTSSEGSELPVSYQPMSFRALANTGTTVQVAGNLGTLTLPGGVYVANQFHFHFPSEHRIGGEEHLAVGELRIVHQKVGSTGTNDLAMVSIMLHLPLEAEDLTDQERFFINLGMLAIPPEGNFTDPFSVDVDFGVFADVLKGNFWQYTGSLTAPPCIEGVQWFIMERHAVISGVVVDHFKKMFPDPMNSRPIQGTLGRVVSINTLPGAAATEAAM